MGKLKRIIGSYFRRPLLFNDPVSTEPVSRQFGMDRGVPIDRYYIEKFLYENRRFICGDTLEIAEKTYTQKFGTNVQSYGILHYDDSNKNATIIGDLTKPETLPENKINCFICTQTLNFIFEVQKAIEGSHKLLKQEGCFLGTVAGISQISRYDMERWGDYWRFTDLSIRLLFENIYGKGNVEVATFGNSFAATAFLKGLAIDDLLHREMLDVTDKEYQVTIGIKAIKAIKATP
jgi:hypothetical protein